jgi:hypothetical protein
MPSRHKEWHPIVAIGPAANLIPVVSGASLPFLGFPGGLAAYVGDTNVARGITRVGFWSALAMEVTAGIGDFPERCWRNE